MKRFFYLVVAVFGICFLLIGWQLWQNNRPLDYPQRAELDSALDAVSGWLDARQDTLIKSNNPILFWMIKQAWENTGHEILGSFYKAYKTQRLDGHARNLWTPFFEEDYRPLVPPVSRLESLQPYQLFLIYGLSCDTFLVDEPVIQAQLEPGFCVNHFLHPRCVTHQVMGLRYMQRYRCGQEDRVKSTLTGLQETIISEMQWDFRVGDAYIQRVSMLIDSGAGDSVKPVWIRRILQAQNADGSWDDLFPITPLPGGRILGLTSTLPKVRDRITGNFHTTAQAVWLLSMLIKDYGQLQPGD